IDERHNYSRSFILGTLSILLGGRAAEKVIFNELTTGSGNDIERATELARRMVCEWGMSERLGPLTFGKKNEEIFLGRDIATHRDFSEETAKMIDSEVRLIVEEAEERAKTILSENLDNLKILAEALLEREVIDGSEIEKLMKGEMLPPPIKNNGLVPLTSEPDQKTVPKKRGRKPKKLVPEAQSGDTNPSN
ncbi:MAG: cell division protein FtsH, partial [Candidatus Neomarinimicrobiota bacterium]